MILGGAAWKDRRDTLCEFMHDREFVQQEEPIVVRHSIFEYHNGIGEYLYHRLIKQ